MNFGKKKVLLVLAMLSFGGSAFGFKWVYNNKSDKWLIVQMILKWSIPHDHKYRMIVAPGRSITMNWTFPYCYKSIKVMEFDQNDFKDYFAKNVDCTKNSSLAKAQYDALVESLDPNKRINFDFEKIDPCIKEYFNSRIWHVPAVFYPTNSFDVEKIVKAMKELGGSAEKIGQIAAKAAAATATSGASIAAPSFDIGLGKLLESMTGLVAEGIEKGACVSRTLDIFAVDLDIPGVTGKETVAGAGVKKAKESAFAIINRQN